MANRLLRRVRDYAQVRADGHITGPVAARGARRGSTWTSSASTTWTRGSSTTIIEKFGGGPVGLNTVAAAVGEDRGTLEEVYEPYLIQQGFLERTPRGRVRHAARLPPLRHHAARPAQATIFERDA